MELNKIEVRHLCANVSPAQRAFCAEHMNWSDWPEKFLQINVTKDAEQDLTQTQPFTEAQWWEFINERVVTPGDTSSDAPQ
jgi:hypothetical protein